MTDQGAGTRGEAERMCGCRDCFARGGAAWPVAPEVWRHECCADSLVLFADAAVAEALATRLSADDVVAAINVAKAAAREQAQGEERKLREAVFAYRARVFSFCGTAYPSDLDEKFADVLDTRPGGAPDEGAKR